MPKKIQSTRSVKKLPEDTGINLDKFKHMAAHVDADASEAIAKRQNVSFGYLSTEPESALGQRLKDARISATISQEELSQKTKRADVDGSGISGAVISLYERGVNRPGPREIRLLCEVLRVTPNYLIYGDDYPFERNGMTEYSRYFGWARTDEEFHAALLYCFRELQGDHKEAIFDLMMGLLRGKNRNLESELTKDAVEVFLKMADSLRLELSRRSKESKA